MTEIGIDLRHEFPKRLTTDAGADRRRGRDDGLWRHLPVFPGTRYLDWDLPDPAGQGPDAVRPIRDEIDARVRRLATELLAPHPPV